MLCVEPDGRLVGILTEGGGQTFSAVQASGVRLFAALPGTEKPNVYFVRNADDSLTKIDGEIPPKHVAGDIDTVVRLAKAVEGSAVWYDRTGVVAHHPDGDRATFRLAPSKLLQQLIDWDKAGGHGCDQATLYKLLRTKLRDALGTAYAGTLAAVREVNLRTEEKTAGAVDRQKTSMGRSVVAEATGPELPDVLTLFVPVFESAAVGVQAVVRVAFDLNPATGQFSLVVLPGEVDKAWAAGERYLLDGIEECKADNACEAVPVYYGQPG